MSASVETEDFDVIILPTDKCPCGQHPHAYVDMLIFRTVPLGIFHKIEIICDFTGKTYEMLPAFLEKE